MRRATRINSWSFIILDTLIICRWQLNVICFYIADDTCLVFQSKNVKDIKMQLNKDFANICDWFVDSKLSIHFREDKTKSILFASKRKIKKLHKLEIIYNNIR